MTGQPAVPNVKTGVHLAGRPRPIPRHKNNLSQTVGLTGKGMKGGAEELLREQITIHYHSQLDFDPVPMTVIYYYHLCENDKLTHLGLHVETSPY